MCDCVEAGNKVLAEKNTRIIMGDVIDPRKGTITSRMLVYTAIIDIKRGRTPLKVFATYCPFCGEKIPI